jgi:succinate dehydrogenase/fumarate reductase flavoprotein subunit
MSKTRNKTIRSGAAIAALHRNSAGAMRHRLEPRGGSRREDYEEGWEDDDDEMLMFFDLDLAAEG